MPKLPFLAVYLCAFASLRETNHFLNQQRLLLNRAKETNRKDALAKRLVRVSVSEGEEKDTKVRGLKRVLAITTNC